jgi:multidrug resistance efflux pump
MNKAKIAAYRASRITRDYTFTDELLDAYEKLEKEDADTAEVLANQHASAIKAQAEVGRLREALKTIADAIPSSNCDLDDYIEDVRAFARKAITPNEDKS